ncbi:MAG: response regulator [Candidatus Competibacteraceae bacterium]|nr:response regulator [Candidatus Competibacteraceae bacterium]MBK8755160.1 response regulator [Candidatus Competibacteraceae bacterium]
MIFSILRNAGHNVRVVTDGQAALEELQSPTRFDLAILDLQMPKLHGTEVIARYGQNKLNAN